VLTTPAIVGTLALPAGSETIAHYWPTRPYTAYHWFDERGRPLGVYLNAATDVVIRPDVVQWLDLALDVLVTASGGVELLDDDEARAAPDWAQPAIALARAHLLAHAAEIAAEVSTLSALAREGRAVEQRKW
jgi:predicted RNA-binding protein associated with RNAse of E/G family